MDIWPLVYPTHCLAAKHRSDALLINKYIVVMFLMGATRTLSYGLMTDCSMLGEGWFDWLQQSDSVTNNGFTHH